METNILTVRRGVNNEYVVEINEKDTEGLKFAKKIIDSFSKSEGAEVAGPGATEPITYVPGVGDTGYKDGNHGRKWNGYTFVPSRPKEDTPRYRM